MLLEVINTCMESNKQFEGVIKGLHTDLVREAACIKV